MSEKCTNCESPLGESTNDCFDCLEHEYSKLQKENQELTKKLESAKEVIKFYADPDHYRVDKHQTKGFYFVEELLDTEAYDVGKLAHSWLKEHYGTKPSE